ncbi:MAG TPA: hypothetical protein VE262_03995 [Blastocatellia bacterium]|jgi:hypothetical protein|nr:hypothetical protein [Blastocatellia bacterium]
MSDKDRQKKDGERKDKKNKAMREAEANPSEKAERSRQEGDGGERASSKRQ